MKIPEFRVTWKGNLVDRVLWCPDKDGEAAFDITDWRVAKMERVVNPSGPPEVKVTFLARLVENTEDAA